MISRVQGNDCLSLNVNPNLLTPFKSFSLPQLDLCVHPLRIVAASRVARSASQHEETLWRKGPSAAVLAFFLLTVLRSPKLSTASRHQSLRPFCGHHGQSISSSSASRPEPPTGVLASGTLRHSPRSRPRSQRIAVRISFLTCGWRPNPPTSASDSSVLFRDNSRRNCSAR